MTASEVIAQLKDMGHENIRRIYLNHGGPEDGFGCKIEDMKKIQKKIKKDYELSLELYDSGISDVQYFAGLIADENKMTKKDLQHWADTASWYMQSEYTVAWIAAESKYGWELALKWIDAKKVSLQVSGWSTMASLITIKPNEELDSKELKNLLKRVEKEIDKAHDRVKYAMNSFVIAAGGYIPELSAEALRVGKAIGKFTIDMGNTSCKVPYSPDYIQKMLDKGVKKKKMARC
jgi:3-methyladenine DNA glycosylase AlkD